MTRLCLEMYKVNLFHRIPLATKFAKKRKRRL